MKFVSIPLVVSMTVVCTQAQDSARGLQSLAQKWNITDPTFNYDEYHFDLDYQVSDFITDDMVDYRLYDKGCLEGNKTVDVLVATSTALTGAYDSDGLGERMLALNIDANTTTIKTDPNIYSEDNTTGSITAQVDFCVRFSLQTKTATPIEVSFIETLVTLFIEFSDDLSDPFSIQNVNVAPNKRLNNTANEMYVLEGFQCDGANVELTVEAAALTKYQGSIIRVCVRPGEKGRDDGIKMRSLDSFTYRRLDTQTNQPAITGQNLASDNGLTSLTCSGGVDVCSFETILFAGFYSGVGIVTGDGSGSMQFGGPDRRLRSTGRALQQGGNGDPTASSDFTLDFGVNPAVDTGASGASSTSLAKVAALVAFAVFSNL